jgi:hypothetical protein
MVTSDMNMDNITEGNALIQPQEVKLMQLLGYVVLWHIHLFLLEMKLDDYSNFFPIPKQDIRIKSANFS